MTVAGKAVGWLPDNRWKENNPRARSLTLKILFLNVNIVFCKYYSVDLWFPQRLSYGGVQLAVVDAGLLLLQHAAESFISPDLRPLSLPQFIPSRGSIRVAPLSPRRVMLWRTSESWDHGSRLQTRCWLELVWMRRAVHDLNWRATVLYCFTSAWCRMKWIPLAYMWQSQQEIRFSSSARQQGCKSRPGCVWIKY